ncbi:uncharacterized protein BDW47DRAFT_99807 [Aspergillus candidus]|uniref:CHY-type domain-containing protein n=1 Tax=Aspergillus candidus TaxID=41067 RepID=A0A2I2FKU1_ASPCN|nr:hypothetical protein BDW47DRAFT_99807 [Aspergillus candidus]PLB41258.1 hypothetical protein BDW47DRAFT_99807 [Aspergillus candidus]
MATNSTPIPGQRPISKAESSNPREFQLNQLRRRYSPTENTDDAGTSLTFGMAPSDPDFPFEMDKLQCVLHVPASYPGRVRPTLKVTNADMGPSFQANVERGFDDIVDTTIRTGSRGSLLTWMNTLDRHLERFLTTTERGPTLKFVPNITTGKDKPREPERNTQLLQQKLAEMRVSIPRPQPPPPVAPAPVYSPEEKAQAEKRRALETKQIEARLGRLPMFQKSSDGFSFTIPVNPTKVDRLPIPLRSIKTVKLMVPRLYPLEPSRIHMQGVTGDEAQAVELGFSKWLEKNSQLNLVSQVNYLTSNMHNLAKTPLEKAPDLGVIEEPVALEQDLPDSTLPQPVPQGDKPHLHVVPRPPEWAAGGGGSGSDATDETDDEDGFSDEGDEDGGAPIPGLPEPTKESGVALSFPFLELYGIELMELIGLNITIKCERCKEMMDVKKVPHTNDKTGLLVPKVETCKKCSNAMSVGFRRQLIHANSSRAGYLDLDGCTIVDLLPSSFIPTCAECSTPFPEPGVVAVRGESAMANCRQCHRKMVFKIPEVKFLKVGSAAFSARDRGPQRKKPKEVLGIVAGQELPRRGRCSHYGKSYRWFRFSCCAKVFPCDKCHDAATDHPNEHANRMICGFCSREQIYRPENCGVCRAVLVGKAGSGFWEGGKGTRNRALMSRKDPRKFKRRGGNAPGGSGSSKKK